MKVILIRSISENKAETGVFNTYYIGFVITNNLESKLHLIILKLVIKLISIISLRN